MKNTDTSLSSKFPYKKNIEKCYIPALIWSFMNHVLTNLFLYEVI